MSYTNNDTPMYYPEDYDYSVYYENELKKYQRPTYITTKQRTANNNQKMLPTINYLNERKCPIYVHNIKKDSSVYNNYNQKLVTPRKTIDAQKASGVQNASKFVLDKLEETYWATWKPKKESGTVGSIKTAKKMANLFEFADSKPIQEHAKAPNKALNNPHGDASDNIIKYFKAKHFDSSSTTNSLSQGKNLKKSNTSVPKMSETPKESISHETLPFDFVDDKKLIRPSNSRSITMTKDSICQEIQTEMHCPVILEESNKDSVDSKGNQEESDKIEERNEHKTKTAKQKVKGKKKSKEAKSKTKKSFKPPQTPLIVSETEENTESIDTFVEHKDSIEITKKKQENSGPREHFQQPKCIRLFRKSGLAAGYIKGGTYPLKSCLKKESAAKGNFRLGAPGSPLFVTASSFSNKRRK